MWAMKRARFASLLCGDKPFLGLPSRSTGSQLSSHQPGVNLCLDGLQVTGRTREFGTVYELKLVFTRELAI